VSVPDEIREVLVREAGTEQGVPPLKRLLRDKILNRVVELMVSTPAASTLRVTAAKGPKGIEIRLAED